MPYSIKQRLLITLLLIVTVTWFSIALINYNDSRKEIETLFDAHLVQSAKVLLSMVDQELYEDSGITAEDKNENHDTDSLNEIERHLYKHKYEKLLAFQINIKRDKFSFNSVEAPDQPLSDGKDGFLNRNINGTEWRVFTLHDPANIITVKVAEPHSVRADLIDAIALHLLIPLIVGLPIISLLIWYIVGVVLRPLNRIAEEIQQRNSNQLDLVSEYSTPYEIRPIINALNRLFYRLSKVMKTEKQFTANAAHELRTPLAGLKAQIQTALLTQDETRRQHAMQNLLKGIDKMTRTVEQLLDLARSEPGGTPLEFEHCNLTTLIEDALAEISTFALSKNITIEYDYNSNIFIFANANSMAILLRNLLDNAIRYTLDGGKVEVRLFEDTSGITVRISDNGPGIDRESKNLIFNRFYRGNQNRENGSGLGMAIVRQIALLHNAIIHLDESTTNGLQVDIFFPADANNTAQNSNLHNNSADYLN